jgi:hypothetical protein
MLKKSVGYEKGHRRNQTDSNVLFGREVVGNETTLHIACFAPGSVALSLFLARNEVVEDR